jgi:hypothetical protein
VPNPARDRHPEPDRLRHPERRRKERPRGRASLERRPERPRHRHRHPVAVVPDAIPPRRIDRDRTDQRRQSVRATERHPATDPKVARPRQLRQAPAVLELRGRGRRHRLRVQIDRDARRRDHDGRRSDRGRSRSHPPARIRRRPDRDHRRRRGRDHRRRRRGVVHDHHRAPRGRAHLRAAGRRPRRGRNRTGLRRHCGNRADPDQEASEGNGEAGRRDEGRAVATHGVSPISPRKGASRALERLVPPAPRTITPAAKPAPT